MKFISIVLCFVMMISSVGCSASQAAADIADLESKIPQAAELALAVLSLTDPQLVPLIQPFSVELKKAADTVQDLLKQCSAAGCSASSLAGINAAVQVGVTNINNIVALVGVKSPEYLGKVQAWAGIVGLIFNDAAAFAASHGTPAAVAALPNLFFGGFPGINLIAYDGSKLPPIKANTVQKSGLSARQLAKHYNALMKNNPKAQIKVPRMHVMGIPVPFTGKK